MVRIGDQWFDVGGVAVFDIDIALVQDIPDPGVAFVFPVLSSPITRLGCCSIPGVSLLVVLMVLRGARLHVCNPVVVSNMFVFQTHRITEVALLSKLIL